jgi:WD40 repeat protein
MTRTPTILPESRTPTLTRTPVVPPESLKLWSSAAGAVVAEFPPPAPPSSTSKALNPPQIHMSPNGAYMAVKYYTDFDLWDTRRAQRIGTLTNASLLAFSPDGMGHPRLAITGNNEVVGIFDLQTMRQVNVIDGGIGRIDLLVFSSDGKRLAIASGRMLRVLDLP